MTTLASSDRTARRHGPTAPTARAMASSGPHSWLLTVRALRTLARQPMYLAFTLVQPMVWLLLFGQLFTRGSPTCPASGATSYLDYLTPGVVVMTAVFSAGLGRDLVHPGHGPRRHGPQPHLAGQPRRDDHRLARLPGGDHDHPVVDRLRRRATWPARGTPADASASSWSWCCATLIALAFAAFSDAIALLVRQQEALIGVSQFLSLPLTFLSSVMIAPTLMPGWVERGGPVQPGRLGGRGQPGGDDRCTGLVGGAHPRWRLLARSRWPWAGSRRERSGRTSARSETDDRPHPASDGEVGPVRSWSDGQIVIGAEPASRAAGSAVSSPMPVTLSGVAWSTRCARTCFGVAVGLLLEEERGDAGHVRGRHRRATEGRGGGV